MSSDVLAVVLHFTGNSAVLRSQSSRQGMGRRCVQRVYNDDEDNDNNSDNNDNDDVSWRTRGPVSADRHRRPVRHLRRRRQLRRSAGADDVLLLANLPDHSTAQDERRKMCFLSKIYFQKCKILDHECMNKNRTFVENLQLSVRKCN